MKIRKKMKKSKLVEEMAEEFQSNTDPFGSYTGTPEGNDVEPVQDVDDL